MKIGRNQKCPCGSGLKYKRCHGRQTSPIIRSNVTRDPIATFQPLGFPGQNGAYVVEPIFPPGDPRREGGPAGTPGDYEVVFTLARPGYPLRPERSTGSGDRLTGDSHLGIPDQFQTDAKCEGEHFQFHGIRNQGGFLSAIAVRCHANNLHDAYAKCYRAVTPLLSQFALRWDVPLSVYQADTKELRKGTVQWTHRNPFLEVKVTAGAMNLTAEPELRTYASVYREALTTDSITYQFLCFYRIIESLHARRIRLSREAARRMVAYTDPPGEVYPSNRQEAAALLDSVFSARPLNGWDDMALESVLVTEALGKPFSAIADILRPIRDNIAHTLVQNVGELISMDDPFAREKVERWLPVLKSIARTMLKHDFQRELA